MMEEESRPIFEADIVNPEDEASLRRVECGYCGETFLGMDMKDVDEDGETGICYPCFSAAEDDFEATMAEVDYLWRTR